MQRIPDDWHQDFFGGLWLEVQRQSFAAEDNAAIAAAVLDILQPPAGSRILDVPCGDGRIAIELASRGWSVTGVERHPEMLRRAHAAADARGCAVEWLQQDMWSLDAGTGFAAAICPWTSIGYGSREQDDAFFSAVSASLGESGLFLFETHVYETLLHDFDEQLVRRAGEVLVVEEREFVPEEGRLYTDWTFVSGDTKEERSSAMQLYTVRELDAMLERAGMKTVASWGSWDLDAFEVGAPILVQLAQKV